jgi:hypothetical protein
VKRNDGDVERDDDTSSLPAPLTPADCDLHGLPWLPLNVAELREGPLARHPDAEAFRAGILAMPAAWHQVPAASLPSDDASLAFLCGYGRDVATWERARCAGALDGWILCSDGRLYHPAIAEKATVAWEGRRKRQAAGALGNERRWHQGKDTDAITSPSQCDRNAIADVSHVNSPSLNDDSLKKEGRKEVARASEQEPERFSEFWAACPLKVDKKPTMKAYRETIQKRLATPDELIAAMKDYAQTQDVKRGFIKHPHRWLRDGRWTDERSTVDPVLRAAGLAGDGQLFTPASASRDLMALDHAA